MFIQTQDTPNPESLMFLPGHSVIGDREPLFFNKRDVCQNAPFARKLLDIAGVENVFLGRDFITITKDKTYDWFALKPYILGIIMEYFINKMPILSPVEDVGQKSSVKKNDHSDPIIVQICDIVETRIRPAVANDGGDIVFHSFEDGIVYLEMKGACAGCPSSTLTLKSGIENMLKFYIPEVIEVRQIPHE